MGFVQRLAVFYIRTKFKLLSTISKRKAAAAAFQLFCTPQSRNRKELPPVFKEAEQLQFHLDQETISGYRWNHGTEGKKKALILHGFESSVVNFERYVTPLVEKGYEVLAFDAPAHGRSSGHTINVLTYKKMIRHICTVYGPINAFIAHSFGGLSLSLALEELPRDESQKVVLIAPAAETTTAIDNFFRLLKLDEEVRTEFDALIQRMGGHPPGWYSVARAARQLKAQVLFLQDKEDMQTHLNDVEPIMKENHPNFRFVISEGLGHSRIYRDNGSIKTIMEFL